MLSYIQRLYSMLMQLIIEYPYKLESPEFTPLSVPKLNAEINSFDKCIREFENIKLQLETFMSKNKINNKNAKQNEFLSKCRTKLQNTIITSKITLSDIKDIVSNNIHQSDFFDDDSKPTQLNRRERSTDSFTSECNHKCNPLKLTKAKARGRSLTKKEEVDSKLKFQSDLNDPFIPIINVTNDIRDIRRFHQTSNILEPKSFTRLGSDRFYLFSRFHIDCFIYNESNEITPSVNELIKQSVVILHYNQHSLSSFWYLQDWCKHHELVLNA